jgi:transposase InsO family protein
MAKRKGLRMNLKKVNRLYCEEGLAVRRRRGRKRALGTRAPLQKASRPDQIWVLDFVSPPKHRRTAVRMGFGTRATDAEWAVVAPIIPRAKQRGRRSVSLARSAIMGFSISCGRDFERNAIYI